MIEIIKVYEYPLANSFLDQGMPTRDLIAIVCRLADVDGSLNKRLYNLLNYNIKEVPD